MRFTLVLSLPPPTLLHLILASPLTSAFLCIGFSLFSRSLHVGNSFSSKFSSPKRKNSFSLGLISSRYNYYLTGQIWVTCKPCNKNGVNLTQTTEPKGGRWIMPGGKSKWWYQKTGNRFGADETNRCNWLCQKSTGLQSLSQMTFHNWNLLPPKLDVVSPFFKFPIHIVCTSPVAMAVFKLHYIYFCDDINSVSSSPHFIQILLIRSLMNYFF